MVAGDWPSFYGTQPRVPARVASEHASNPHVSNQGVDASHEFNLPVLATGDLHALAHALTVDAYNATVQADPAEVVRVLCECLGSSPRCRDLRRNGGPRNRWGYAYAVQIHSTSGVAANVRWGGNGGGVSVEIKGNVADDAYMAVRNHFPGHACSHLDVAIDLAAPTLFDEMFLHLRRIAMADHIAIRRAGDWDYFQRGRSAYFGALTSVMQVVLYEKGLQLGHDPEAQRAHRDLVRLELRVRPHARDLKVQLGALPPCMAWALSPWTARAVLTFSALAAQPALRTLHELDASDALAMMLDQYHQVLTQRFGKNWDGLARMAAIECARRRVRTFKR